MLAAADIEGTGAAFRFIADFMSEHKAVLDALLPRNVMFTKAGQLCLADPVTFVPLTSEHAMTVFPGTVIHVNKEARSAQLCGCGIRDALYDEGDDEDGRGEVAVDAVESVLLALAAAGFDLGTPEAREAIETALGAIAQNL